MNVPGEKINVFVDKIAKRFKPEKIILFGSYGYGTPAKDSDVDILVIIDSKRRPVDLAIQRAREVPIKRAVVRFASPEDVIIHKIFAGRARDLNDVKSILLKNPSVDLPYIETWLADFDKNSPQKRLLRRFKEVLTSILKNR